MKNLSNLASGMLVVCATIQSQAQMKNWFIAPNKIDVQTNTVVVTPIAGSPATANNVANGVYDTGNNLVFYIADGTVYDYNNTAIGTIPTGGTEVIIVPFGTNDNTNTAHCSRKYNIFSTSGGFTSNVGLYRSVLDMNSYSLSTTEINSITFGTEFGAIAVGLPQPVTKERYLYFMAGSGFTNNTGLIRKLIIYDNGTVSTTAVDVYPTATVTNSLSGIDVFSRELDLSPDGQWLGWASYAPINLNGLTTYRYHYIKLNATGDLDVAAYGVNAYQEFNLGLSSAWSTYYNYSVAGFRGVEFYQNGSTNKLFVGAGNDGIFSVDVAIPYNANQSPTFVNGSSPYGFSQIERAYNGKMYASSTSNTVVGAFDPTIINPAIMSTPTSFLFTNPPKAIYSAGGANPNSTLYTLPDQLDAQNYSLITPSPITQVVTTNTLNYPANASTNQTTTWTYGANPLGATTPVHVTKELRVRQNSNLTIQGMTFKFSQFAKVIIEPGSTLTLDDLSGTPTVLTSNYTADPCNVAYTWLGAEVWGSASNASQNITPLAVGKLTIKDNSRIEYAVCGARAQRFYSPAVNVHRGGIIIATTGAAFKNCIMDVEFLPYQNIFNGTQYANKSYFSNTTFWNDVKYTFSNTPQHAYIEGCIGIRFIDCDFTNFTSQTMFDKLSMGIKSLNANFTVSNGSTFSNLYHAIDAKRTSGTNTFTVLNSIFTNNQTGIYADNISNFVAQLNTFNIGNNLKAGATTQLGIATTLCSGFTIEENSFNLSSPNIAAVLKYGISSNSCGSAPNQIYKNYFTNIDYGNFSSGINRNTGSPTTSGLQYLCNLNSQNDDFDFFISNKGGSNAGIRLHQGTSSSPAGNTFSYTAPSGNFSDFNNATTFALNYYYKAPAAPADFNSLVVPISISPTNSCPSHICNPPCDYLLTNTEIQQLTDDYGTSETAYLNLLYSYNQLMDGGNTNALLTQIQQNWSADAVALRDELLSMSPYLSPDALREAASLDLLPPAMLLMVCLANPDATRDEELLAFLQYEIPNPLSQYMIDLIRSSWDDDTPRTTMENLLADYNSQMSVISDKLLADLYNKSSLDMDSLHFGDTTNYVQQIRYWLNRIQTLSAKYDLIENYLAANEVETAEQLLDAIPNDFNLTEDQAAANEEYNCFFQFRKSLLENELDLSMLDNGQIDELINFIQGDISFAKGLAQNALCFYYEICREDDYSTEGEGGRMMYHGNAPTTININEKVYSIDAMFDVSPNPATTIATFTYSFPSAKVQPILSICDMTGKEIKRFTLIDNQGKLYWDTSTINSGLYYYTVKDGNTKIAKGKISVKK